MKNFLLNILKIFICLFLNGFLFLIAYIPLFASKYDWQLVFYLIFFIILALGTWAVFFVRSNIYIKIIYVILFLIFINAYKIFPSVKQEYDFDSCIDSGECAKGVKFGDGIVDETYCIKHNAKLDKKQKECNFR